MRTLAVLSDVSANDSIQKGSNLSDKNVPPQHFRHQTICVYGISEAVVCDYHAKFDPKPFG